MPYITEELWQQVAPLAGKTGETISLQPYPESDQSRVDKTALADIEWVKESVLGVRKIRAEMNINPGKKLPLSIADATAADLQRLEQHKPLLQFLARLSDITVLGNNDEKPDAAVALVDQMQLLIPMDGLIDKEAEVKRLNREIEKYEKETTRLAAKLDNPGFTGKAPPQVVELEKQKLADAQAALENLKQQLARFT
jgi:valyl-tRNA synthetase